MVATDIGTLIPEAKLLPHSLTGSAHVMVALITRLKHALLNMVIHRVSRTSHELLPLPTIFQTILQLVNKYWFWFHAGVVQRNLRASSTVKTQPYH